MRTKNDLSSWFTAGERRKILLGVDVDPFESINRLLKQLNPLIVINCIGIIKQIKEAKDPILSLTINSLFPKKLAYVCKSIEARLLHISTDCVFSGMNGNYSEDDFPDATDIYGHTKFLGEVDTPGAITLRTSIIGHELKGKFGLLDWFLSQQGEVSGYTRAIYSGFPTIEIARILKEYIIPKQDLCGVYYVSSRPISKYELLSLIAKQYKKKL